MKDKQIFTTYLFFAIWHLISIIPIQYTTILLIGKADNILVISYGIFNAIFLLRYFRRKVFLSFLLGFLIPSLTICVLYFLWFQGFFSKSFNPVILFIIASFILCVFFSKNQSKIESIKNINLLLLVPTLILFIISLNLKETYPTKTENMNLIYAEIKIVDNKNNPKSGEEIEVSIYRQPLFGLRESHEIYKTVTNENGIAKIQFSKTNDYSLTIYSKENKLNFYDINSEDLKKKNFFLIEN